MDNTIGLGRKINTQITRTAQIGLAYLSSYLADPRTDNISEHWYDYQSLAN